MLLKSIRIWLIPTIRGSGTAGGAAGAVAVAAGAVTVAARAVTVAAGAVVAGAVVVVARAMATVMAMVRDLDGGEPYILPTMQT